MQICIRHSILGVHGFIATLYNVQALIIWNFFEKLSIQDLRSYKLLEVVVFKVKHHYGGFEKVTGFERMFVEAS